MVVLGMPTVAFVGAWLMARIESSNFGARFARE